MGSSDITKSWIAQTRATGFAVLTTAVAACSPAPDTTLKLVADTSDAQAIEETRRILLERFDDEYPQRVEASVEGSVISVTFKRTSPDRALVQYLYQTPGRLQMTIPERGAILFTTRDVHDARSAYRDSQSFLYLQLAPAAAERLQRLTGKSIGARAQLVVDGRVLSEARIESALPGALEVTLPGAKPEEARQLAIILRSGGHLPAFVSERG